MEGILKKNNQESRETYAAEAYFSVSNLVRHCNVIHEDGRQETFDIAILGGKTKDGAPRFQAIGGGAKLSDAAIEQLKAEYPNMRFRDGEEADDARFYIPVPDAASGSGEEAINERDKFVHDVMDRFNSPEAPLFKCSDEMSRELVEELTEVKDGLPAPLSEEEAGEIKIEYTGAVSPIQWGTSASGRAGSSAYYYRTFHLYDITVSEKIFEKLRASDRMRVLSEEDVAALRASTQKGEAAAKLGDGSVLAENVFPAN